MATVHIPRKQFEIDIAWDVQNNHSDTLAQLFSDDGLQKPFLKDFFCSKNAVLTGCTKEEIKDHFKLFTAEAEEALVAKAKDDVDGVVTAVVATSETLTKRKTKIALARTAAAKGRPQKPITTAKTLAA